MPYGPTRRFAMHSTTMNRIPTSLAILAVLLAAPPAAARADGDAPPRGQRIFTCGHSFHAFVPEILAELARESGIEGHEQIGVSSINASKVVVHWNVPEETNVAKKALRSGAVDVLTLSPLYLPDPGIENFTSLALEHNADIRVLVQNIWLRFDVYEPTMKRPATVDHDAITIEELRRRHQPLFDSIDQHVQDLNRRHGRTVLFVVPAGQAVVDLRERIVAGQAPGLETQEDLFADPGGHGRPPLKALVAYCNYAVVYRRSPVGLPVPEILRKAKRPGWDENLNRVLQEVAWNAATSHPLSGVRADRH